MTKKTQIPEFYFVADEFMRANQNIDFPLCKSGQDLFLIGRLPVTAYIIDIAGKSLQPRRKCFISAEVQGWLLAQALQSACCRSLL